MTPEETHEEPKTSYEADQALFLPNWPLTLERNPLNFLNFCLNTFIASDLAPRIKVLNASLRYLKDVVAKIEPGPTWFNGMGKMEWTLLLESRLRMQVQGIWDMQWKRLNQGQPDSIVMVWKAWELVALRPLLTVKRAIELSICIRMTPPKLIRPPIPY